MIETEAAGGQAGPVTAAFLIVGNEILSGRTQDRNLAFLASALGAVGVQLREVRVVPDVTDDIVAAVNALRSRFDYLFTSGGIGPTHDDITTAAVAAAFDLPVVRDPEAYRRLQVHYGDDPSQLNAARAKMADVPQGASLIDNPVSAAPGFRLDNLFVMAGVPRIFQAMVDGVLPGLRHGARVLSRSVSSNVKEGDAAEGLAAIQAAHPGCDLGSYPFFRGGVLGTSLVARGTDPNELALIEQKLQDLVAQLGATLFADRPEGPDGYA